MQLTCTTLLLAALSLQGVVAQPYRHQHKKRHEKRDLADVDWNDPANYKGVDWKAIDYTKGQTPAAPAPEAAAPAPADNQSSNDTPEAATPSASPPTPAPAKGNPIHQVEGVSLPGGATGGSTSATFGQPSTPVDNGNKDEYIGNVGIPYGSNMKILDSCDATTGFDYTNTFTNGGSEATTVIVWNKSGKDGQCQSGMSLEPNLRIPLQPNQCVAVAFQANSQVGFSADCSRNPAEGNIPDCTWGELDFADERNGGWSGCDRSSIPNSEGNTGLLTVTCGGEESSQSSNSFTSASQSNAGGAVVPGPAHMSTVMGA